MEPLCFFGLHQSGEVPPCHKGWWNLVVLCRIAIERTAVHSNTLQDVRARRNGRADSKQDQRFIVERLEFVKAPGW
ncbi:hypothetical protein G6F24_018550 [Rhizopus arrhizus]|nr:hypothetical protein G6F24_018550 [Rhizopus arrhizus]